MHYQTAQKKFELSTAVFGISPQQRGTYSVCVLEGVVPLFLASVGSAPVRVEDVVLGIEVDGLRE